MKKLNKIKIKYTVIIAFAIGLVVLCSNLLPTNMRYFADVNLIVTGYAKETRKGQYLIKFHSNCDDTSLTETMEDETMNYLVNRNLTKNTFKRADYRFVEWNTKADGTGDSFADEQEITPPSSYVPGNELHLYAQWKEKLLVTFDGNGGTIPASQEGYWTGSGDTASKRIDGATYGEMPRPTREGYTFLGWSLLPKEYQAVEYIESTGTQYIDTGVKPSNTTGVYAKLSSKNISDDLVYFGAKDENSNDGNSRFWIANNHSQIYYGWNSNTYRSTNITAEELNRVSLNYLNDRKEKFNDEIVDDLSTITLNENKYSVYIFAGNKGVASWKSSIKLYELKISNEDKIIHNYVPCYRKSDNVIGLYDIVNGVFHTNQGTGTFNKGGNIEYTEYITTSTQIARTLDHTLYAIWGHNPTVTFNAVGGTVSPATKNYEYNSNYENLPTPAREGYTFLGWKFKNVDYELPSTYQEVEYIESTGTQYIETEIVATNTTGIYAKLSSSDISTDTVYIGSNSPYYYFANSGSKIYYGWNNALSSSSRPQAVLNEVNEFGFNYMNSRTFTYKDTVLNLPSTLSSGTRKMMIFAGNWNGSASYKSKMKLYELKISEGTKITHHFIPCYKKSNNSDNEIGLYDTVNGVFYTNEGTGTFNKGKNVENKSITSSTQMITNEDHTLYAVWGHNPTVTFDANGGTVSPQTKTYNYNSNYTNLPTPTKEGYTFKGWVQSILPDAYQGVEYIETTGTQYISTDYTFTSNNVRFKGETYLYSKSSSERELIGAGGSIQIGTGWGGTSGRVWFAYSSSNSYAEVPSNATNDALILNNKFSFDIKFNSTSPTTEMTINGSPTNAVSGSNGSIKGKKLYIFTQEASTSSKYIGRLYNLEVYDNGILVSNLIPCYRKSDNVIGLYDTVRKAFLTNSGTGDFIKGNNCNYLEDNQSITNGMSLISNEDHTLYAIWEENE